MKELILKKINEIEEKENVRVLHCVESGSRAWGFASPDSDYDVRFIYARPRDYYLRLDKKRDVIEWQLDDTLDINGWDIQKTLILARKSNPTLFEWSISPIVYKTTNDWKNIADIIGEYFVSKSGIYHYLSTAKSNYREHLKGDKVRYKKYFYVLRPLLACKWILDRGTPPPMEFETLTENYLDKEMTEDVKKLLDLKINSPEIAVGKPFSRVNEYLEKTIDALTQTVAAMPDIAEKPWDELNALFLEVVK